MIVQPHPLAADAPWVVLKFGGSSVARVDRWRNITALARQRREEGARVLIVVSALAGVTDALAAIARADDPAQRRAGAEAIAQRHIDFAGQLGVDAALLAPWLAQLAELAASGGQAHEQGHCAWQAQLLALGELMSSTLGNAALRQAGLVSRWLDAREFLQAEAAPVEAGNGWSRWLSAEAARDSEGDPAMRRQLLARQADIFISQGFIARDGDGCTVLLGRGGSDTSAACFGARLQAQRVEIWSDVAGLFSANPRQVPGARLLQRLDFEEAQEIAFTGARMLHPRCLGPLRRAGVPLSIRDTERPDLAGTLITPEQPDAPPSIKAISARTGITLVSMETAGMWQQVGFLADVFAVFKRHGLSVDLIGTAQTNVTVSLDPSENLLDSDVLAALCQDLANHCRVRAITPCTAISLVGRGMRGQLHRLRDVLAELGRLRVHLISQSSNDLNLTFVLDQADAEGLLPRLHAALIAAQAMPAEDDAVFGPSWGQLYAGAAAPASAPPPWWRDCAPALLAQAGQGTPTYVYHLPTVRVQAQALRALNAVQRWHYAVKANPHPAILRALAAEGLDFECVSPGEVQAVQSAVPGLAPERILFTPSMAAPAEYAHALTQGLRVTFDSLPSLSALAPEHAGQAIALRLDIGPGRGRHAHIRTGEGSKFGLALADLPAFMATASARQVRVETLHAHLGSGIADAGHWREVGVQLASLAEGLPHVRQLNLGGGLAVPYLPGEPALDLAAVGEHLTQLRQAYPDLELWLEPGRFLVAEAGVLLTRVNQVKHKGTQILIGCDAGMHTLLRPALYEAWHGIVNLDRLDAPPVWRADVVGPICESADVLGEGRRLPETVAGDVLLVAMAGAYGAVMASAYNLRQPARELVLDEGGFR
ncbi:MAG: bifunctional aspartate kinase/diaminopimelate decarboxylase [Xanthomonadales bacterium]|nr:bifunctional aspartate kinase/diaminopimelate decarboxylase [Xanthomonadales bacterium]